MARSEETKVEEIHGTFCQRIYRTDDASYCVALYQTDKDYIRVVGANLPEVATSVCFRGRWGIDRRFGRQFVADTAILELPKADAEIVNFIASLHVGIGKKRAEAMVRMASAATFFKEIEQDPMQFLAVKGINEKAIMALQGKIADLSTQTALYELFGADLPMSAAQYRKIVSYFKGNNVLLLEGVKNNPFVLMQCGYTFAQLDEFVEKRAYLYADDPRRLLAAAQQALSEARLNSHVGLPEEEMVRRMDELTRENGRVTEDAIKSFLQQAAKAKNLFLSHGLCYLPRSYREERQIAEALTVLAEKAPEAISEDVFRAAMADYKEDTGITLSEDQQKAVWTALTRSICVITGGPGTGKSTILDALLYCWKRLFDDKWLLMAPTGKASVRMTETTGQPASTIHSALQLRVEGEGVGDTMDQGISIDSSLVIVDEASMLDQSVMCSITLSLDLFCPNRRQHLILVGDPDQLPSVGWGNVLADIISSGVIPVCTLRTIYRQGAESPIVTNSAKMQSDETDLVWNQQFKRYYVGSDEDNMEVACKFYLRCVHAYGIGSVAMLSPYRRATSLSTNILNAKLQQTLNPDLGQGQISAKGKVFRKGDRVMQTKNTAELSNGDIGTVAAVYPNAGESDAVLTVEFESGERVDYIRDDLMQLDLAYALSIHKSQGSQYDAVIVVLPNRTTSFLRRNLLYTAITRSKQNVAIIGSSEVISYCIHNNKKDDRHTRLAYRLQQAAIRKEAKSA